MEFKGTKGKWEVVNNSIKLYTNIICGDIRIAEVKHYNDPEDLDNKFFLNNPVFLKGKANAKLIASAPEMFEDIKESITSLKILRNQIAFESKKSTQWIGMAETIDKWIEQKQQLLTKITG